LQSPEWRKFQESAGRKTFNVQGNGFWANVIEHALPIVGKYFYIPRGPIYNKSSIFNEQLISLAKENGDGWIRIEPATEKILNDIKNSLNYKITKAPHDMQPRESLIIDISKSEEDLLSEMKAKTRYNINLAIKKGVTIKKIDRLDSGSRHRRIDSAGMTKYLKEFLRLTNIMAKRQDIVVHPENYYQKMIEAIPGDVLKLYAAAYEDQIIAANLVIFFGDVCIYLHGASDDNYRNVMAPYLLQWRQIQDAKAAGCKKYDFGGVSTNDQPEKKKKIIVKWSGITRFKTGFSPNTKPVEFPGSYDIIINPARYWAYRVIQKTKSLI